jgi:hypothetical protein
MILKIPGSPGRDVSVYKHRVFHKNDICVLSLVGRTGFPDRREERLAHPKSETSDIFSH